MTISLAYLSRSLTALPPTRLGRTSKRITLARPIRQPSTDDDVEDDVESREGSSNKGMEKHDKVMEDNVEQIEIIKIMTT